MGGFQVGDVVVCVDVRDVRPGFPIPKGAFCRVSAWTPDNAPHPIFGYDGGGIQVEGFHTSLPGLVYFAACRFRKIRPASDEFIEALRACKPERIGEPGNV